jgi:membrane fusion protein, multidrug efflux system
MQKLKWIKHTANYKPLETSKNYIVMKNVLKILVVLLLVSCGGSKTETLKKKIDSTKTQIAKLETQLANLQKELALFDTSVTKTDAHLVAVKEIAIETFDHYIEVQGSLDGDNNIAVFPEAMGIIEEVYAKVGQHVNKGQVLARMNDAAVHEQIKGLEAGLELATTIYEKQKVLWDQNIGSEVQYLTAKNTKETLEAQLASAKKQLDMMQVKSPITGTVEDSQLKVGQTASPQFPAFRVVNFGQIKVVTDVAEAYASKIKIGDEILVYLPDIKKEYKAQVNFASNFINQINRTFRVEATLKESDSHMKANMVAVLKINDYKNGKAIILPMNYIQKDQNGTFVFVAEKSGAKLIASKRSVATGQIYNGLAEITSGLNPGDKLITLGYLDVEVGENIKL